MTISLSFFNHTVPHCKFTSKFQIGLISKFTSILFKKFKVQFKKRNPGERRKKLYSVHSRALVSKSRRRKSMNPFPGKFTTHSSMNYSCIIQQFSSDYSLRENNSLEKNLFLPSSCISRHSNGIMCKQPIT